jgi:Trp operon repressor
LNTSKNQAWKNEHLNMENEHLQQHQEQQEQESVQWRRDKVLELSSQGHSQREISTILQVSLGTVNKDLSYLRTQSKQKIRRYIDETLPNEYEKCLVGITSILREAWSTSQNAEINKKEKIHALTLAKECYSMKLDLLTNATVVNDAMKFVSSNNNQKKLVSREEDSSSSQESKEEPDYDEDKDQLEENQEVKTEEIVSTTNQVF